MKKIKWFLLALIAANLFFSCKKLSDPVGGDNSISNEPVSNESVNDWFTVETCSNGMKVTLADDVVIEKNQGCGIGILETPIFLVFNEEDIDSGRKEFVIPWGIKGQTYTVEFRGNCKKASDSKIEYHSYQQKCVSGDGLDYTKYFDIDLYKENTIIVPIYSFEETIKGGKA